MALNNLAGSVLALLVLVLLYKAMGPKVQLPVKRRRRNRAVRVDPLLAKERKLAFELRQVRAELRDRQTTVRDV